MVRSNRGGAIVSALLGLFLWSGMAQGRSPSWTPDMPPEVQSWRQTILTTEAYEDLVRQWRGYAGEHPESAMAQVQLSRALRYTGTASVEEQQEHVRKAYAIDPECPEALEAMARTACFSSAPLLSNEEGREYGLRAVTRAPDWAEPHFVLWSICTILGRHDEAREHLRSILAKGGFPAPLVDYAYNMLQSADAEAIVITNGDNDTYPPLALQAVHGTRRDVAIVNLSLLQMEDYAQSIWQRTFEEGPFERRELEALHASWKREDRKGEEGFMPFSYHVVRALIDKVGQGKWKKPVYFATTVSPAMLESCERQLRLEGLLYRVTREAVAADAEADVDVARTMDLFQNSFRMDSATDLAFPWESNTAVARLMKNYPAVLGRVATEAGARGEMEIVATALERALRILDFHGEVEMARGLAEYWKKLDPRSTVMDPWLEK